MSIIFKMKLNKTVYTARIVFDENKANRIVGSRLTSQNQKLFIFCMHNSCVKGDILKM